VDLVKAKDGPGSDKKIFGPEPEKKNYSDPGPGLGMPAAPYKEETADSMIPLIPNDSD
jgi:hypothetical protein